MTNEHECRNHYEVTGGSGDEDFLTCQICGYQGSDFWGCAIVCFYPHIDKDKIESYLPQIGTWIDSGEHFELELPKELRERYYVDSECSTIEVPKTHVWSCEFNSEEDEDAFYELKEKLLVQVRVLLWVLNKKLCQHQKGCNAVEHIQQPQPTD